MAQTSLMFPGFVKGFKQSRTSKVKRDRPIRFLNTSLTSFFGKVLNKRRKWFNVPCVDLPFIYFSNKSGYTQQINSNYDKLFIGHFDKLKNITTYIFGRTRIGRGLREVFNSMMTIPHVTPKEIKHQLANEVKERRTKIKNTKVYSAVPPPKNTALEFVRSKIQNREAFLLCEELLLYMFHSDNMEKFNSVPHNKRFSAYGDVVNLKVTPLHSYVYVKSWMIIEFGGIENALGVFFQHFKNFDLIGDLKSTIKHRLDQFGTICGSKEMRGYRFFITLDDWTKDIVQKHSG